MSACFPEFRRDYQIRGQWTKRRIRLDGDITTPPYRLDTCYSAVPNRLAAKTVVAAKTGGGGGWSGGSSDGSSSGTTRPPTEPQVVSIFKVRIPSILTIRRSKTEI